MAAIISESCAGCGTCVDACPVGAISVDDIAVVNADECVECGSCVEACPVEAISME